MPTFFDLLHQGLRGFLFGFGDGAPDPELRLGFERRPAPECAAFVFLQKPFFAPLWPT
jgi:hypothetical protein